VSEYQFYHFQVIDQPLNERQMQELRNISTRADITPTSFVNHYNWGDLKANSRDLMWRYFDAHVYTANWGTHRLMLKIPRDLIDLDLAEQYCAEYFDIYVNKEHVILDFVSEDEAHAYDDMEEVGGWMASLLPLRDAIMQGDLRTLYLGWLANVREEDDTEEPPLPPGMSQLSGPLQTFARFMRIDEHLLQAAAQGDAPLLPDEPSAKEMAAWVSGLAASEKDDVLLALLAAKTESRHVIGQLRHRFYKDWRRSHPMPGTSSSRRTADEVWQIRERLAAEEKCRQMEQAARERAERERKAAEQRKQHLDSLALRQASVWEEVTSLLTASKQDNYDAAVRLLGDLRDLATNPVRLAAWQARVAEFRQRYSRRPSLMQRFDKAGFP
jgi:hypothetical protein